MEFYTLMIGGACIDTTVDVYQTQDELIAAIESIPADNEYDQLKVDGAGLVKGDLSFSKELEEMDIWIDWRHHELPINISVLDGQFEDEQNNTHTMAGSMAIKNGSWVERPECDDLKAIVNDLAGFATPEQEFANGWYKPNKNFKNVEEYVEDMGSDRLYGEYLIFMKMVRRAQTLLKESAQ